MNYKEFKELSTRTMPFNGKTSNVIEHENFLCNYSLGLIGEATELLEEYVFGSGEELKKELGDVAHYAVGIAEVTDFKFNFLLKEIDIDTRDLLISLNISTKEISESTKKYVFHRHPFDLESYEEPLKFIFNAIFTLSKRFGFELSEVLEVNIEKLKKRYPDKFDPELSINR